MTSVESVTEASSPVEERLFSQQHFESFFASGEDPWDYGSDYEQTKYRQTLSLLPEGKIERAIELGCAEGQFTALLASRVGHLLACDISPTALRRTAARCRQFSNVQYRELDMLEEPIGSGFNLIVCSEAVYYMPRPRLEEVARRMAEALAPGGHLLMAHGHVVSDDRTDTGFDWGGEPAFGAFTIGAVFSKLEILDLVKVLRSELYSIVLFRRVEPGERKDTPAITELPLSVKLTSAVSGCAVWDGAIAMREEALQKERTGLVPVLMYHSVAETGPQAFAPYRVSPKALRDHLRLLKRHGFYSLSLDEWAGAVRGKQRIAGRPVVITFDDGYLDFVEFALPILVEHGFSATMFVVTERVGGSSDWDAPAIPAQRLMGWDQLRLVQEQGIAIGSHSLSHKDLLKLGDEEVRMQAEQSRRAIAEQLGNEPTLFSYPWGQSDERVRKIIETAGYDAAVSTSNGSGPFGGLSSLNDDIMALQRVEILGSDSLEEFARKVWVGGPRLIADMKSANEATSESLVAGRNAWSELRRNRNKALPEARVAGERWVPKEMDERLAVAARLNEIIADAVDLQTGLFSPAELPSCLQRQLSMLFTAPLKHIEAGLPARYREVSPGIRLGFTQDADVAVETIRDEAMRAGGDGPHALRIRCDGWFAIEAFADWVELNQATKFQVGVYGRVPKPVKCGATLRLRQTAGGGFVDIALATLVLTPACRSVHAAGELQLPEFDDAAAKLDLSARPILIFNFGDQGSDVLFTLDYLAAHFS